MGDFDLDSILSGVKIDGASPYVDAEEENWNDVETWISTGALSLDYAIAGFKRGFKGGIPIGKAIEFTGKESCCKSIMIDHIIRETVDVANGIFLLCDPENAHLSDRLKAAGVKNYQNLRFIKKPKKERLDSAKKKKDDRIDIVLEEFFAIAKESVVQIRKKVPLEVPLVLALDSLAAIKTELQYDADDFGMSERTDKSRVMEDSFATLCSMVSSLNGSVILVNQIRTALGVTFGNPERTPGGDGKNFAFSLRIRMGSTKPIHLEECFVDLNGEYIKTDTVGVLGHGKIFKNKLAEPFREFRFPLVFNQGIIKEWCLAMTIIDREKWNFSDDFERDGNTYVWRGEKLGVGEKGLTRAFLEDEMLMNEIEEALFF